MRRLRNRLAGAALSVLALTVTATGCGGSSEASSGSPAPSGAATAGQTVANRVEPLERRPAPRLPATVRSADGEKVTVEKAERVVPLSGSLSEIVFTLGLGDRVVARDVTATFAQAAGLPVVTRGHDVSAESVLSLRPDLVIAETTTGPAEAVDQIRAAGIPVLLVAAARGLDDVGTRIRAVAGALGVPAAGQELTRRSEQRIEAARKDVPHGEKPRVAFLYLRGSASVYLIGGADSGAGSLIEAAGAVDAGAASGLDKDFTAITSEALVKAAPDAILVMSKGLESVGGVDGLVKIPGVAQTPAGLDRRIVSVEDGVLLNYGPRTDQVLRSVVAQLYGEDGAR
ncbi:ABC transporter substrate-binding protein [Streptomyces sp. BPPL-273]|uniref:ABC transporter substrate-binding protein n=1 Tax=Streptomyces parvulus TaxID=146923 RepID=A0A191UWU8_9ACTN|nr:MULTISPECIES: ABC transporter substrate-binding protein [Streptomyces]ANJ07221.1 ABC transporter substrate-binding protein [Streptomyces parvulus]MCQ4196919.1 ABC transporter substrate-binding protein [Streptomyces parvulus]WHM33267.1 ABC transporter substrate-binding protein [Streptomyces sp. BPPL-273]GGR73827.1 ABC transporter substrate-binding protein [Streptomyces parvulus]